MKNLFKRNILKYSVTTLIGLAAAYAYIAPRDIAAQPLVEKYHILCDAFTLPGMFLTLLGLMIVMSNLGALDMISYAFHYLLHTFFPILGEGKNYLDYVEDRREHRAKGFGFLLVVGLLLLAVAVVFLLLYLSA